MPIGNLFNRLFPNQEKLVLLENHAAQILNTLSQREAELEEARKQLDELRHRTKNDLQALTILCAVQLRIAKQPEFCMQCVARVNAAAELHTILDCDGETPVQLNRYLASLCAAIFKSFDGRIRVEQALEDDITLDGRRCRLIGLIFMEAVTNALKHAFIGVGAGRLAIQLERRGDDAQLIVQDEGQAFDPDTARPGLGVRLMKDLARQLDGAVTLEPLTRGCCVRLRFRIADA